MSCAEGGGIVGGPLLRWKNMSTHRNQVILVDAADNAIGAMDKLLAHQCGGQRHRAFSIFILNSANEFLLQKRAAEKYHAANMWSNACCSHPQPEEQTIVSANKRLKEELGFDTDIFPIGKVEYKANVGDSLTEWEVDHLFVGQYDGAVAPNPDEVSGVKWVSLDWLESSLKINPDEYAPWFKFIFPVLKKYCEHVSVKYKDVQ